MAVVVDYVKVRHSAVALLLARFVFEILQEHTLCESVNAKDFGWLGNNRQNMLFKRMANWFSIQEIC